MSKRDDTNELGRSQRRRTLPQKFRDGADTTVTKSPRDMRNPSEMVQESKRKRRSNNEEEEEETDLTLPVPRYSGRGKPVNDTEQLRKRHSKKDEETDLTLPVSRYSGRGKPVNDTEQLRKRRSKKDEETDLTQLEESSHSDDSSINLSEKSTYSDQGNVAEEIQDISFKHGFQTDEKLNLLELQMNLLKFLNDKFRELKGEQQKFFKHVDNQMTLQDDKTEMLIGEIRHMNNAIISLKRSKRKPEGPSFIPITTKEAYWNISKEDQDILTEYLCTDMRATIRDCVRVFIRTCISDEFTMNITYTGDKKTIKFLDSPVYNAIYNAVLTKPVFAKELTKEVMRIVSQLGIASAKQRHREALQKETQCAVPNAADASEN